ncbi:MurR/RpiR family transcriptional regulator [Sinosporangium album]|uniref:MurR/RpiR family transcriptional regulator n=1 Tax=Sinosporangium album TaxID=504805 RepID=UPI001FE0ECE3|nr:MurR/RpiR family transcriptional regulator [Sinosporangium album]
MGDGLQRLLAGKRLSPTQRRIAHYLSGHLHEAVFLSSVELAERAGVSQPSVTRFATALGFAGYPELRNALRPLVVAGPWGLPASAAAGKDEEVELAREALGGEIANLTRVRDRLAGELGERVRSLGASLAAAEPLPVLGLRVSSGLATGFAYYARRIHPDVRLLVHGGSELHDRLHTARRAGAEWLLAVVLPRYPVETVQALQFARSIGLRIAVITDSAEVPFPADVVLDAPVGDRLVFDSHAAPLVLAMLLVEAMADALPLRTQARLEEHERMTDATGVFLQPGG